MTLSAAIASRPAWRGGVALRVIQSILWSFAITAVLILLAGKNPLSAYQHIVLGAFGSWDRIVVGLNKAAPYMLAGVGVALCFRGNVANMGAEGQIAIGGLTASVVALMAPARSALSCFPWRCSRASRRRHVTIATRNPWRGVHEVPSPDDELHRMAGGRRIPARPDGRDRCRLSATRCSRIRVAPEAGCAHRSSHRHRARSPGRRRSYIVLWHTVIGFAGGLPARASASHYACLAARSVLGLMLVSGVLSGCRRDRSARRITG
jgi:simple sugar transport system permease protein